MTHNTLGATIAAAILDGMAVTFSPAPANGTSSVTRVRIGVRHERRGRIYEKACEVVVGELTMPDTADTILADVVADTCRPGV